MNHKMDKLPDEFGGYPVKEAKSDFLIHLQSVHVEEAEQADPTNCAFARACKDIFKSPFAWFWRRWAYIVLPDDDGDLVAWRYVVPRRTCEQIIEFDHTGVADSGGYWLKAPTEGQTLEARRSRDRAYKEEVRQGKRKPQKKRARGKLHAPKRLEGVRSGTGQVRFAQVKDA